MATRLSQIIAVEKGVKSKATRTLTDAYHNLAKSPLLSGISRTYQPKDDEADHLPSESTLVQIKTGDVIAGITEDLVRLFDVTLTKDAANCVAKADVVVDGTTLLADVPVPYLLFLEKQLTDLNTFVSKLPVLDPSENWTYNTVSGAYESDVAQTTRTRKVPRNHVKAEATDKHPAQVEVYHEDVIVGTWSTKKFSGGVPADRVSTLVKRVEALQTAVKFAREEANATEIADKQAGKAVLDYIFS